MIEHEEQNELDRDIVGHDVFGMIYHLYRPGDTYSRYKKYSDLRTEERRFANRIGWRSLLNMVNTNSITGEPLSMSGELFLSGAMGYCLAPFGDFIDEKIYITYGGLNIGAYARQAQNRRSWFPAGGVSLVDYKLFTCLALTGRGHLWMQPDELDFNTTTPVPGGALELDLRWFFPNRNSESSLKAMGMSLGCLYKTAGFMPEIESHDEHFSINMGVVFRQ